MHDDFKRQRVRERARIKVDLNYHNDQDYYLFIHQAKTFFFSFWDFFCSVSLFFLCNFIFLLVYYGGGMMGCFIVY